MQIMGAKVDRPVQWIAANVVGVVGAAYLAVGQPWGDIPNRCETIVWIALGVVAVRVIALAVLVTARIMKIEEN